MPNKMLVDATHPEETRVVVLRGHRVAVSYTHLTLPTTPYV